jgi:hypothetical protein
MSAVVTPPSPPTSGTSLTVVTGEGALFPAAPFNATVCPPGVLPSAANAEIVRVTARSGDVLTITRAQEGSVARAVVVGDLCVASITAKALQDIETTPYARTDAANTFNTLQTISYGFPALHFNETTAPANARMFDVIGYSQELHIRAISDDSATAYCDTSLTRVGDLKVYRDLYEKQRTTPMGHWISVPFNAANFYGGGGMTWTVTSGQVSDNTYTLIGRTLIWSINVAGTLGGTMANFLYLKTPVAIVAMNGRVTSLGDSARAHDGTVNVYDAQTIYVERTDANAFVAGGMALVMTVIGRT